jgi:hypothetical protein
MKNRFGYSVALRVKHPHLDPTAISNELGLVPTTSWKVGDPRQTPKGATLEGVRKETYCSFDFGRGEDGELAQCLLEAVGALTPQRIFLREIRSTGGSMYFYVFWYPNGDTGEMFEIDLLMNMADLGIGLGINVYDDRDSSAE